MTTQGPESFERTLAVGEIPPSPEGLLLGAVLGSRYEIVDFLGAGGMGEVYRARDRELDEVVALKILRASLSQNPALIERFRNEVRLARRVTHRAVARTFEFGEASGVRFLTMEFVDGEGLSRILARRGTLAAEVCARIAADVCSALDAAHAAGVVHRDIKPDNILITPDRGAVVTDFGVARLASDGAADTSGTPYYMAPEQVRREAPTPATDIYALGVTLFEVVTGKVPFDGATAVAVMAARLDRPPPDPRMFVPSLPADLAAIILRAMSHDPAERYSSALDMKRALDAITDRRSLPPPSLDIQRQPLPQQAWTTIEVRTIERVTPDVQYLTSALFDELTLFLTRIPRVRVAIGPAPESDVVLTFAIASNGKRLVGSALGTASGETLWSARLPLSSATLSPIADTVSRSIALAVEEPGGPAVHGDIIEPEVLDLCLRARFLFHSHVAPDIARSVEVYAKALEIAPRSPRVLAGHAMAVLRDSFFSKTPPESLGTAERSAELALLGAPDRPEPHLAAGHTALHTGDPVAAARHFRGALGLAPAWGEAHEWLGRMLIEAGFVDDAIRRLDAAMRVQPGLGMIRWEIARAHALDKRWDTFDRLVAELTRDGQSRGRWVGHIRILAWRGEFEKIREIQARIPSMAVGELLDVPVVIATAACLLDPSAWPEHRDKCLGRALHERFASLRRTAFFCQIAAELAVHCGDHDNAFLTLERAVEAGLFDLHWIDRCPILEPIRHEPRFQRVRDVVVSRAHGVFDALYQG